MVEANFRPVVIDLESTAVSDREADYLSMDVVGGVILFSRNYTNLSQLADLCHSIKQVNPELIICVDHEGGRVQRFRQGFTLLPSMQQIGRLYIDDAQRGLEAAKSIGFVMASELISQGVDHSFAPVLDLDLASSKVIGDRAIHNSPNVVVCVAEAFIDGLHQAGMFATGKHFPGHGGVVGDSHLEHPVDLRGFDAVNKHDLLPFRALAKKLHGVMPAHITFPEIDSQSVGFSKKWLDEILRKDLGFAGVIFSDDLSMAGAAVAGGYAQRVQAALLAGCDAVLACNSPSKIQEVITSAQKVIAQEGITGRSLNMLKAGRAWGVDALKSDRFYLQGQDYIKELNT